MKELESLSNEELVLLANAGNREACDVVLDRNKSLVRASTRAFFLAGADRDDLMQEGMIGLYKAIQGYDASKNISFISFAELCIKRQVMTAVKTATRKKHMPLNTYISINGRTDNEDEDNELNTNIDYGLMVLQDTDPEEIIINAESSEIFNGALREQLSDFEQCVLAEFFNGRTYQEIADSLDKDIKSVDNALQRIKKKLRNIEY